MQTKLDNKPGAIRMYLDAAGLDLGFIQHLQPCLHTWPSVHHYPPRPAPGDAEPWGYLELFMKASDDSISPVNMHRGAMVA